MTIYETVIATYPELENSRALIDNTIEIRNDTDGFGDYISIWNYHKPIPDGLTLGKPTAQHNL